MIFAYLCPVVSGMTTFIKDGLRSYMSWKIYCCFVLQPRIFVLLRRCIFDSDDEVSFFRIVHFAKFI